MSSRCKSVMSVMSVHSACEVPSSLKVGKFIPVFKKGRQSHLNNYCPISLLSIFNKLLEKLMYNRIVNYFKNRSILYEKQFGFRAKHSTNHAILSIVDNIQRAIENKEFSCGVFLDFSKAFDTVNHSILIKKTGKLWDTWSC